MNDASTPSYVALYECLTLLVFIRLFRFYFGYQCQNCIQKINSTRNVTTTIAQSLSKDINEDRSEDNKTIEIQEKNAHTHDKRTIDHEQAIDCWLTSISAYPNVVRLFGEFSSEVLQVMLGLSKDVTTTMTDY